jgi:hypothetical protein
MEDVGVGRSLMPIFVMATLVLLVAVPPCACGGANQPEDGYGPSPRGPDGGDGVQDAPPDRASETTHPMVGDAGGNGGDGSDASRLPDSAEAPDTASDSERGNESSSKSPDSSSTTHAPGTCWSSGSTCSSVYNDWGYAGCGSGEGCSCFSAGCAATQGVGTCGPLPTCAGSPGQCGFVENTYGVVCCDCPSGYACSLAGTSGVCEVSAGATGTTCSPAESCDSG